MEAVDYFSKIPQSVLVSGASVEVVAHFVETWAATLLDILPEKVNQHPDFHAVRPVNKMRQIGVDALRDLNRNVYTSSQQGGRKVFVIYEADRLNVAAANALLKTLEEPTSDTSIFLVTVRPYDLLPTVRSRCWCIQYNEKADNPIVSAFMQDWLSQFKEIVQCYSEKQQAISPLKIYGLLYRLQGYLNQQKDLLDTEEEALEEEVKIAQKASLEKRFVQEIFGAIELTLSEIIHKSSAKNAAHEYYSTWIQQLELCFRRIEVNLGPIAALEPFLLQFCKPL